MTPRHDVVIAGAGPAGTLTATLLARRGARVLIVERSRFPRPKLCGDTLNPGALAILKRHFDVEPLAARALRIDGMLLTGPGGVAVRGEYGSGTHGLGITRDVLDSWLMEQAAGAGAEIVEQTTAADVLSDGTRGVAGIRARARDGAWMTIPAVMTIAADGRRSRLAAARRLSACASRPRRWAIGAYFDGVRGLSSVGEMHVRRGYYIGVAPTADGRANACLVEAWTGRGAGAWPAPETLLRRRLDDDELLAGRFAVAAAAGPATVLGPLAIEAPVPGCPGMLLAGDAAGFVDPMTGDGIRLALSSAEIAASVVGAVLSGRAPVETAHVAYARELRRAAATKRQFNRAMRALVGSPAGVALAARTARVLPGMLRSAIRYAGDAGLEQSV